MKNNFLVIFKKSIALLISFLIVFSPAKNFFEIETEALELEDLRKKFPTEEIGENNKIIINAPEGKVFYFLLDDEDYQNISIKTNGIVSAKYIDYDPETMVDYMGDDKENKFITYKIHEKSEDRDVETGLTYYSAKTKADKLAAEDSTKEYEVVAENFVHIVEVTVEENYTSVYQEGKININAMHDETRVSASITVISDVHYIDYDTGINNPIKTGEIQVFAEAVLQETENLLASSAKQIKGLYFNMPFEKVIETAVGATKFSYSGTVPDGMKLIGALKDDHNIGEKVLDISLSGTPTKAGNYTFEITCKNEDGSVNTKTAFSMTVGEDAPFDYIQKIKVDVWPEKLNYTLGETIDTSGMKVIATACKRNENVVEVFEYDVTDIAWIEPEVVTTDDVEAMNIEVFVSAPASYGGSAAIFSDFFRITIKNDEFIEDDYTESNDIEFTLNVFEDDGYSAYYSENGGVKTISSETPAYVISKEVFEKIAGGKLTVNGENFVITIPKVSSSQGGINFYHETDDLELKFFSYAIIQSDYTIEWNTGLNYFELREAFSKEDDKMSFYILDENDKCVDELVIDYNIADIWKTATFNIDVIAGEILHSYKIATAIPIKPDNPEEKEYDIGDANNDGNIDVMDVNYIRRSTVKLLVLNNAQAKAADVNGDGKVNSIDANYIRRYIVKLIDSFPASAE